MSREAMMDDEIWMPISEFPDYQISNFGRVWNNRLEKLMQVSVSNHGHAKVGLTRFREGRWTRSVAVMVADAFCPPPNRYCDQVIFLDGDITNLFAGNLTWRPASFAWKYTRQLKTPQPNHYITLPVREIQMENRYENIMKAGVIEGLLFEDIWRSTYTGDPVYPTGSIFEVIK